MKMNHKWTMIHFNKITDFFVFMIEKIKKIILKIII